MEDATGASSDWCSRNEAQGFVNSFPAHSIECVSFTVNVPDPNLRLSRRELRMALRTITTVFVSFRIREAVYSGRQAAQ